MAGALLEQSLELIDRGIHPIKIADGFEKACHVAVAELDRVADRVHFSRDDKTARGKDELFKAARTSLGSKMSVSRLVSDPQSHSLIVFPKRTTNFRKSQSMLYWRLLI